MRILQFLPSISRRELLIDASIFDGERCCKTITYPAARDAAIAYRAST
jgi:hypothetical protein